jgi:hypothetical protein
MAQETTFGAIAYSFKTHRYGYSTNESSRADAERSALRFCKARDCRVQLWFRNSCAVLITGDDGDQVSWAWDPDVNRARIRAMKDCRNKAEGCRVVVRACSSDEGE